MEVFESLPVEYLRKKWNPAEDELLRFRKEIQQKHISFLTKHESVLITDLAEIVTESSGNTYEVPSVLTEIPDAKMKEEWTWNFDLHRSDYYNKRSVFRIAALLI